VTVNQRDRVTEEFESQRAHLHAVAYRVLGSWSEADDAVQEAWLRLDRSRDAEPDNLGGWLTTVVARISLDMLRARRRRREALIGGLPEPVVALGGEGDPEHEALLADSVGLALLVVLETLTPAERLAFVLHDMFAMPFGEIAEVIERTPEAARQLASRARRRVRGATLTREADLAEQRRIVGAFLAASRAGDFDALLALLDPDVVFRAETAGGPVEPVVGARAVAARVRERGSRLAPNARPALVNGVAGAVVWSGDRPVAVVGFAIAGGRIAGIDVYADPGRLPASLRQP
jgi:RNA polymerase sigma-70 factor (ECF subfamily)